MPVDLIRLEQANRVLDVLFPGFFLEYRGRFFARWDRKADGAAKSHGWVPLSKGCDYPRGSYKLPFGGTGCVIVSHLIRWIRREPVMGMRCWRYWFSETVGCNKAALPLVLEMGWPTDSECVMCHRAITSADSIDWFNWNGAGINMVGPGCHHSDESGCRGKNPKERHHATL